MNLERVIAVRTNETVYRGGDQCIKVFGDGFTKADALGEALNQARVEECGLHVPKVLEVSQVDGKWALVTEYVEGKTLERLIAEEPGRKEELLERMAELQVEMISKSCPLLSRLREELESRIARADLPATTRCDLFFRLQEIPAEYQICHGDFNPSNIVLTRDDELYLLDWSHASQGNAAADAANAWLWFRLAGDAQGADRYLELFCQKTGMEPAVIQKWIPIVAAARSAEGGERERTFLLKLVNGEDYE